MRGRFPASESNPDEFLPSDSLVSLIGAILGWLCLLTAGVLFAVVYLSPRLMTMAKLEQEHATNHIRLVSLENQLQELKDYSRALESDPEVAAAIARVEITSERPGEQRIEVQPHLSTQTRASAPILNVVPAPWPWYSSMLEPLMKHERLSNSMLIVSALLVMIAFVPFQVCTAHVAGERAVCHLLSAVRFLRSRYTRSCSFDSNPIRRSVSGGVCGNGNLARQKKTDVN